MSDKPRQRKSSKKEVEQLDAAPAPKKRGRKTKYETDEERREARRKQNREYRARRREELIKLRRQTAQDKNKEQSE